MNGWIPRMDEKMSSSDNKCSRIFENGLFNLYLDSELSKDQEREFMDHISACDECAHLLHSLETLHNVMTETPEIFHPSAEDLVDFAKDGKAPSHIFEHLKDCHTCHSELEALREHYKSSIEWSDESRPQADLDQGNEWLSWVNRIALEWLWRVTDTFRRVPALSLGTAFAILIVVVMLYPWMSDISVTPKTAHELPETVSLKEKITIDKQKPNAVLQKQRSAPKDPVSARPPAGTSESSFFNGYAGDTNDMGASMPAPSVAGERDSHDSARTRKGETRRSVMPMERREESRHENIVKEDTAEEQVFEQATPTVDESEPSKGESLKELGDSTEMETSGDLGADKVLSRSAQSDPGRGKMRYEGGKQKRVNLTITGVSPHLIDSSDIRLAGDLRNEYYIDLYTDEPKEKRDLGSGPDSFIDSKAPSSWKHEPVSMEIIIDLKEKDNRFQLWGALKQGGQVISKVEKFNIDEKDLVNRINEATNTLLRGL
jgi:hypothetical protein